MHTDSDTPTHETCSRILDAVVNHHDGNPAL